MEESLNLFIGMMVLFTTPISVYPRYPSELWLTLPVPFMKLNSTLNALGSLEIFVQSENELTKIATAIISR
jgi:hypothetical protein